MYKKLVISVPNIEFIVAIMSGLYFKKEKYRSQDYSDELNHEHSPIFVNDHGNWQIIDNL